MKLTYLTDGGGTQYFVNGEPLAVNWSTAYQQAECIRVIKAIRANCSVGLKDAKQMWDARKPLRVTFKQAREQAMSTLRDTEARIAAERRTEAHAPCPDCAAKDALLARAKTVLKQIDAAITHDANGYDAHDLIEATLAELEDK
jgi:hypothetical protein